MNGNLKTSAFISYMLGFLVITLGFFYWAFNLHESRIGGIEKAHIIGEGRFSSLEAQVPAIKNDITEIKHKLENLNDTNATLVNSVGDLLRLIKQ